MRTSPGTGVRERAGTGAAGSATAVEAAVGSTTTVTVVGSAATPVELSETRAGVPVARFRLAATTDRRRDGRSGDGRGRGGRGRDGTDGHTSFYTVWAARSLAANVATSVTSGEPLVVHGLLRVREEERDGRPRLCAEIEAMSVGHDLTYGTAVFRPVSDANPALTAPIGGLSAY
ncbi:single-stranded DNA-binding protein [Streptomyces sp. NPDC048639]|uniref:single-stranded DNA-binding protein n=1 Tax=Streptomyces sp. NPDC048639 TaxID=3365581 RepID=UPI00371D4BF7